MNSKTPPVLWVAALVVTLGECAFAQNEANAPDKTQPGRLVDSASTNTRMSLPNWDLEAHKSSPPPESDIDSSIGDGRIDAAPAPAESPANHAEPATQTDGSDSSPKTTARDKSTTIPRPEGAPMRTQGEDVVPRNTPTKAAWYRHPLAALIVVFGAIAAIAWVFRKYVPASRMIPMSAVRVVGRAPISAKHSIALLHVGQRLLLVGMTSDRVSTLSEITDPQEVSLLLGSTADAAVESAFGKQLTEQLDGFAAAPETVGVDDRSLLHETKGQLQSLMKKLRSLRAA